MFPGGGSLRGRAPPAGNADDIALLTGILGRDRVGDWRRRSRMLMQAPSLSLSSLSLLLSFFFFLALCVFHHSFLSFLSLHTHLSTLIYLHTGPIARPCNNLMQIRRRCPLQHTQLGKLSFSAHIKYIMALIAHGLLLANPKECPHLPISHGFLAGLSTGI